MAGAKRAEPVFPPPDPVVREGKRVRLREPQLDDAEIIDRRAGDPEMLGAFNDFGLAKPRRLVDNLANGKRTLSPDRGQLLVIRIKDDAIIGDVSWHTTGYGPNPESRALNMGIALIPEARGHGYGTEAQRLLAELLFELYDVGRVEASTDIENIPEQRSLEKAGFTREGVWRAAQFRGGARHDLVGYSILREDVAKPKSKGRRRKGK